MKKSVRKTSKRNSFLSVLGATMLCAVPFLHSCFEPESATPLSAEGQELILEPKLLQTRATDTKFVLNDTIGLFAIRSVGSAGLLQPTGNYEDNIPYVFGGDGVWRPDNTVRFPADGSKLDLYLYYPYRNSVFIQGTTIDFQVETDQSVGDNYTRSDLSSAFEIGVAPVDRVQVNFFHRLSQIQFALKAGVGYTLDDLDSATVKLLGVETRVTYDLSGGPGHVPLVVPDNRTDVTPYGTWRKDGDRLIGFKAVVAPQKFPSNAKIEVKVNDRTYFASLANVKTLESSKSNRLTVVIGEIDLNLDDTLHDWDEGGEDNLNAGDVQGNEPFITEWEISAGGTVSLPISKNYWDYVIDPESGGPFPAINDITIAWGDGAVTRMESYHADSLKHTYLKAGTYQIKIAGICQGWSMGFQPAAQASVGADLTKIIQWGEVGFCTFESAFADCEYLTEVAGGMPNVKDYGYAFSNCGNLTFLPENLLEGCTNALDFQQTFSNCTNLSGELPKIEGQYLWERAGVSGGDCFQACFNLTEYNLIPGDWK